MHTYIQTYLEKLRLPHRIKLDSDSLLLPIRRHGTSRRRDNKIAKTKLVVRAENAVFDLIVAAVSGCC